MPITLAGTKATSTPTEDEKADLRAMAAGRTRRQIATERREKPRVVEARIKKSLERFKIFVACGKISSGEE